MLLAACAGPAGTSAGTTISPASGPKQAGFAGNTGTPSALPTGGSSMSGMPMSAAPATAAAPVPADAVAIRNFAFGPQVVTVKAGTTVHWTNSDTEAHTVTSNTGAFGSAVLQPGASYSFTFTKPGTYHYRCTIHPFMTGTVMVS
jgi:plastocyanin